LEMPMALGNEAPGGTAAIITRSPNKTPETLETSSPLGFGFTVSIEAENVSQAIDLRKDRNVRHTS